MHQGKRVRVQELMVDATRSDKIMMASKIADDDNVQKT